MQKTPANMTARMQKTPANMTARMQKTPANVTAQVQKTPANIGASYHYPRGEGQAWDLRIIATVNLCDFEFSLSRGLSYA